MFQGDAIEILHGDERLVIVFSDVVNGADVGMVESGGRTSFSPETFQCLRVLGHVIGKELKRNETTQLGVLGFVNYAHTAAAELFDDAIARDGLADHWRESYVGETGKSMNAERFAAGKSDGWRGKLILNAASFKLARPSGDHISDPLAFASIGERDEESLRRSKNVHWRSVYLP